MSIGLSNSFNFGDYILPKTSIDFESLADCVATDFVEGKGSLNFLVLQKAKECNLNPNELQRLVELTNIKAVLKVLGSSKNRLKEFELADYNTILKDYVGGSENVCTDLDTVENPINDSESPIVDEDSIDDNFIENSYSVPTPSSFSLLDLFNVDKSLLHDNSTKSLEPSIGVTIIKLKKEAEKLYQEKIATELAIYDNYDILLSEFHKLDSPDFTKFAQEVYALHDIKSLPILESLSKDIKKKMPTDKELSKVASETLVIDDTEKIHKAMNTIINSFYKLASISNRLEIVEDLLNNYRKYL